MNYYSIYGSCLGTSVRFPELRAIAATAPKWTFDTTARLEPMRDVVALGAEQIYGDVHARLYRHAAGHRITVDDTGEFDLSSDGRRVTWQERAESWPDFVRAHLMGRVLATSMFFDGMLPMHGSAVAFDDGIVAFIAPKGYGKSSLALALTRLGARLVTDDTLPVDPAAVPLALPGVHSMRLRPDSVSSAGVADAGTPTREGKLVVADIPLALLAQSAMPLRAIYLLNQAIAEHGHPAASRAPLPEVSAAFAVVAHVKIARMLGASLAPVLLDRAVNVARSVPVYRLFVEHDLARIPEVAETIMVWHR